MDTRFQQVWDRVVASGADTAGDDLEKFMEEERRAAEEYSRLAGSTRSAEARRLFQQHASEEREHLKKLQAMAYLLRGKAPTPPPGKSPVMGERPLQALRRRFTGEQESAEAYRRAAERTKDGRLRSLFTALAQDAQRHGDAIWTLMQRRW